MADVERCPWRYDDLLRKYHDEEWGTPVHDDQELFEHLTLDCMQAGLSWITILRKREAFRQAFGGFRVERVAEFSQAEIEELLANPRIVRNRLKIQATVNNARCVLKMWERGESLGEFLWSFVGGKTRHNHWRSLQDVPAETPESRAMSSALKARGFSFVGPTVCYAFMQAVGMVNDHLVSCFRHRELIGL
ncbi:MAG: DNA-3-methyladenine glycosylase I [Methanomassiliicoccales archaeon]